MSRRVETFVEAVRELRAIQCAMDEEGETTSRLAAFTKATVVMKNAEAQLTGAQLGLARRLLARPVESRLDASRLESRP